VIQNSPTMNEQEIISRFETAGQEQVFRFYDQLDAEERKALLAQASEIDLDEIAELVRIHLFGEEQSVKEDLCSLEPAPYIPVPERGGDIQVWQKATRIGVDALRGGEVAAFVVAGGQGTRLGYDGPKGTFPITPVRRKPLFQVFAEKIRAAESVYEREIPWFIMTSRMNHEQTCRFFEENSYFGLSESQVFIFTQGLMPAVDSRGKIMLETPGKIAMSPDGHGGSLRALVRSGSVKEMEARGIQYLSYFQVDNPLVNVIDPAFIGFHISRESRMSSKMVPKAYPEEKVGVFCVQDNKTRVVEYSDLPETLMKATDEQGNLKFSAGSIAIHILSRDFIRKVGEGEEEAFRLPFHRAHKAIGTVDSEGNPVKPDSPNGYKFEMFVFDALPFAGEPVIMECRREEEFSPVKNSEGKDSPETCRRDQIRKAASWLIAAGEPVILSEEGLPDFNIEISPLFAETQQEFIEKWKQLQPKPPLTGDLVLE